jgi:hypothetical protein
MNKKSAVMGLVAVAVLAGGAAVAYPPSSGISVAATATSNGSTATVLVTVSNANPSCDTRIKLDGANPGYLIPASHSTTTNTVSTTLTVPGLTGRHNVSARTENCPSGSKEHAKSDDFVVQTTSNHITYPATAGYRVNYLIQFTGLTPTSNVVSATATGPGGDQDVDSDTVDRRGEATLKLKFTTHGTWSIVVTITGPGGPITDTKVVTV